MMAGEAFEDRTPVRTHKYMETCPQTNAARGDIGPFDNSRGTDDIQRGIRIFKEELVDSNFGLRG